MPPFRTASNANKIPPKQPARTERTHEENQERAYIAASRRSDRSIEARVESARRASEIHKRRTGRSLKVTEKDVQNEEMYEEEDDDLPMQFRRFSALHPGQPYSAFTDRVNNYMTGQIGMRNYLHEAIYNANQNTAQHKYFNALMQQQQQRQQQQQQSGNSGFVAAPFQNAAQVPWSPTQATQPEPIFRTESFSYSPAPQQEQSPTFTPDARAMSLSLPSPGSRRRGNNSSSSHQTNQQPSHSPTQTSTSARHSFSSFDEADPFSATLPANQQQLLDGNPAFANGVHPSQMTPGLPLPSNYHHQFDILSKTNNTPGSEQFAFGQKDLNQTLTTQSMHSMQSAQSPASIMPTESDFGREMARDSSWFDDSALFDFDRHDGVLSRPSQDTQQEPWAHDEFFDIVTAST